MYARMYTIRKRRARHSERLICAERSKYNTTDNIMISVLGNSNFIQNGTQQYAITGTIVSMQHETQYRKISPTLMQIMQRSRSQNDASHTRNDGR